MKNAAIIIPFHLPWAWNADFMKQTAKILARNNTVFCLLMAEPVFFRTILVEAVRGAIVKKSAQRLWLVRPIHFIPFGQSALIHRMNIQVNLIFLKVYIWTLSYQNQFVKKILWIFSPKFAPYLHLFSRSYTTLYDCVDYVWDPIPTVNDAVRKQENSLIRSVDFMVVNSHVLYDAHKTKKKNIVLVQLGFRLDSLKKNILTKHRDPLFYDKPIIGFIGVINYRLDYSLLYRVAANNPRWNFVFYGPQEVSVYGGMVRVQGAIDRLTKLPNVFFRERTAPDVAHDVIRVFDICMIPYNTAYPINRYCYPMKLFEYFYMGKPVISTPIEELRRFPKYVKIGKSVNKWENHIEKILSKPWPKRYKKEQKLLAVENSWDKKISYIASLIK